MTLVEFLEARISDQEATARRWLDIGTQVVINPLLVLAECAAKRRIVRDAIEQALWIATDPEAGDGGKGRNYCYQDVLRILAVPYSTHPDYDDAWSPLPDDWGL